MFIPPVPQEGKLQAEEEAGQERRDAEHGAEPGPPDQAGGSVGPEVGGAALKQAEAQVAGGQEDAADDVGRDGDPDRDIAPVGAAEHAGDR